MGPGYKRLPDTVTALYSELLQRVLDAEVLRAAGDPGGGFTSKTVKGRRYWYYQSSDGSSQTQTYVGPETPELLEAIKRHDEIKSTLEENIVSRKRLVQMLIAGGAYPEQHQAARIITSLARSNVFLMRGMLVGSYAFSCYGNLLGVRFEGALAKTRDMDVACQPELDIAIPAEPQAAVKDNLIADIPGLESPAQINPWVPPVGLRLKNAEFKVEFLTSAIGADKTPIFVERFKLHAQPLPFMGYLLEEPVPTVVLYREGILVNVPEPSRFALHKLAVSQLRPAASQDKAAKDLRQAKSVLRVILEDRPGSLHLAWEATTKREDGLADFVKKGLKRAGQDDVQDSVIKELGLKGL